MSVPRILTVNGGSSSLKFAVFDPGDPPRRLLAGAIERIGLPGTTLRAGGPEGPIAVTAVDPSRPGSGLLDWLDGSGELGRVTAVAHRVVHGGPDYADPRLVTPELIRDLRRVGPLDPAHLPAELALMEAFAERCPGIPQVACFDTAFHRALPAGGPPPPDPPPLRGRGGQAVRVPWPLLRLPDGRAGSRRRPRSGPRPGGPRPSRGRVEHGGRRRRPVHRHHDGLHADRRAGHGHPHRATSTPASWSTCCAPKG